MKHIRIADYEAGATGRQLTNTARHEDDEHGWAVAVVEDDEPLRLGETEIDEATYWSDRGTLVAYNEALPPVPVETDDDEKLAAALTIVAKDPALAAATKTALTAAAAMLDARGKRKRGA